MIGFQKEAKSTMKCINEQAFWLSSIKDGRWLLLVFRRDRQSLLLAYSESYWCEGGFSFGGVFVAGSRSGWCSGGFWLRVRAGMSGDIGGESTVDRRLVVLKK